MEEKERENRRRRYHMDGGEEQRNVVRCSDGTHDKAIINQIMLRFRPIAPKPANGLVGQDSDYSLLKNESVLFSKRRNKRKCVMVYKNSNRSKRIQRRNRLPLSSNQENGGHSKRQEEDDDGFNKIVTLQLLPESSDELKESAERERLWCNLKNDNNNHDDEDDDDGYNNDNKNYGNDCDDEAVLGLELKQPEVDLADQTVEVMVSAKKVSLESWMTVECVTDASCGCCMAERGVLGRTDMERMKNLEVETRPGFISDGSSTVRWVNGAYKRMMITRSTTKEEEEDGEVKIFVGLRTKQKLMPYIYCSAFTCWVRLEYWYDSAMDKDKNCSQIVPCDVWRMDCGGLAWRLDVEAALSLGR